MPSATATGYKKRNFYLAKQLSENKDISLEVRPLAATAGKIGKLFALLTSFFSSIPYAVRIRTQTKTKRELADYIKTSKIDLVICDGIHQSLNVPENINARKILYEHNVESEILRRYSEMENNITKKVFVYSQFKKFVALQKKMWQSFDSVICCSEQDRQIMLKIAPIANIKVIPNGVDISYFSPNSHPAQPYTLVYTGQIGWKPNEDALLYFTNEIYSIIKQKQPNARLLIVGNNPGQKIKALSTADSSITVTGFVDDVRDYINKASVYIAPIRIGSGTRLKILEAFSMKKPVVSTSIGCEGLDVKNEKNIIIKDNPIEFAEAVLSLFSDETRCKILGEKARRLVEEKYDWNVVFKDLDKILDEKW